MRAMASEQGMSSWTDLLHSSTKLLEQAAPSAQFPPLQRNLDQLEALSKKLKAKTLRTDAPSQSIAATRLLAREGINVEQLTRDLKSFELKTTFEDVFPAEATSVEEYLHGLLPLADKPVVEKKVSVYAEVVRNLNNARQQGLPFKVCTISACGNFAVLGTAGGWIERFNLQSGISQGSYVDDIPFDSLAFSSIFVTLNLVSAFCFSFFPSM
ncbi:nuclear pore complex protein NUP93B-like [Gossypium hirsutum]|uniref:Nuclear pore complex protein NUP93B-like n=1 Tax=Gossypium hirsutum TaxID=3635 RepID=A0ABM2ZES2_GOSHI|nr:nuclear pore complex protein NUP93B-like [Gossypium hirsutum]